MKHTIQQCFLKNFGRGQADIIHLMSAREGNSFIFPRGSMFPAETKSRETLRFEGKQNYFPREQTLSVFLYSARRVIFKEQGNFQGAR